MYNIKEIAEIINDKRFDEEIHNLKLRSKYIKEVLAKEKNIGEIIRELNTLKLQVSALSTKK